ncbi:MULTISPECIES: N-acetyltransferase [Chelatococcus]|uniref:Ribosomal protein S18 acetylase RimI-like enzyme n=1 Tax=Chelatococcus caeni TaxID=1348468 RepID=A0A840C8G9_9HYPH|nr:MULTISPECIES: GNAT family N-acetyltransferase [Chelatococcus]MBB4019699.1 ribosomal protein S18 acetylase RimI-like enzyme [Chelatococcus caeni]
MINIRPVKSADIEALYAVSLLTGFEGRDASHLYDDPKMMGHIYAAPYAVLEPQLALVIEDSQGIAGFAVGVIDTKEWEDRLEREWWPQLRLRYADPPEASRDVWTPDERRASMIHHPTRTPAGVVGKYPAHLHLKISPRIQGGGFGSKLFDKWRSIAVQQGAKGIHVGVNRANTRAIRFWGRLGFGELTIEGAAKARTVWMGNSTS